MNILLFLFLTSLPFGYRIILRGWTPGFDEYETAFLYANDFLMLLFLGGYYLEHLKKRNFKFTNLNLYLASISQYLIPLSLFLLFSGLSIYSATIPALSLYNFGRLIILVLVSLAISDLLSNKFFKFKFVFGIFSCLAIVEALIGSLQFYYQKSIGLWWLGESFLGPRFVGSAKIIIDNISILRAYGTFPHPNILGAFLIIGLLSLYYFWLKRPIVTFARSLSENDLGLRRPHLGFKIKEGVGAPTEASELRRPSERKMWSGWKTLKSDLIIGLGIFVVFLGIVLTFSRSAWFVSLGMSFMVILASLFTKHWIQAMRLTILVISTCLILLFICSPFIFSRSQISSKDPAVFYRLSYNNIGIELIKKNPLGVGLGNQLIYSVDNLVYRDAGMKNVWEWQPIHNLYLLIASEIGVFGFLFFVIFLAMISVSDFLNLRQFQKFFNIESYISKIILFSLLSLGLVDHYLWTIEPGRLMLWVVLGMVMGAGAHNNLNKKASP